MSAWFGTICGTRAALSAGARRVAQGRHGRAGFRNWVTDGEAFAQAACEAYDRAGAAVAAITPHDPDPLVLAEPALRSGSSRCEGCGPGAAGLRWIDLDLNELAVMISQQRITFGHTITVGPIRTAASSRTIALDATTARVQRVHRQLQMREAAKACVEWVESGYGDCLPLRAGPRTPPA